MTSITVLKTSLLLYAMLACNALPLFAQAKVSQNVGLRPLSSRRADKVVAGLDRSLLPGGVDLNPDLQKVYLLRTPDSLETNIVAAYFNYTPTGADKGPPEQCGVFIVEPNGKNTFISTIGPDFQHGTGLCGGVRTVGSATSGGLHPRLICIFSSTRMHGEEVPQPFILAWDTKAKSYFIDNAVTEWLWNQPHADTVPQIRRLLRRHG